TGANGFVGKNLTAQLNNIKSGKARHPVLDTDLEIIEYTRETDEGVLDDACKTADFVFHLAGVNRPKETEEFMSGNFGFTSTLLEKLKLHANRCPIVLASSTQAALDNPYGRSKKAGEDAVLNHFNSEDREKALIYRFPNVFGKWA